MPVLWGLAMPTALALRGQPIFTIARRGTRSNHSDHQWRSSGYWVSYRRVRTGRTAQDAWADHAASSGGQFLDATRGFDIGSQTRRLPKRMLCAARIFTGRHSSAPALRICALPSGRTGGNRAVALDLRGRRPPLQTRWLMAARIFTGRHCGISIPSIVSDCVRQRVLNSPGF